MTAWLGHGPLGPPGGGYGYGGLALVATQRSCVTHSRHEPDRLRVSLSGGAADKNMRM